MFCGRDRETIRLQDCITEQYDMIVTNPTQIAANCDCSESYAKETFDEYHPEWNDDSDGLFDF